MDKAKLWFKSYAPATFCFMLGIMALCFADLTIAAPSNGQFNVTATLVSAADLTLPKSAFCRTTPLLAFGAIVTIVCATGEVVDITAPAQSNSYTSVHGGAYRFILPISDIAGLPGFYDGNPAYGTAASWRVIRLADRDYYELLVLW